MKSSDYWKKRMTALEDMQYQKSAAYYQDVQEQYRIAINDTVLDIEHWYQRLADNNEISLAAAKRLLKKNELDEFHWSVEQYIKAGKENAVDQHWMKELENASAKYHISYLQAMKLQMQQHAELLATEFEGGITTFLHKSYGDQYYRTAFEIAKGTEVGSSLAALDTRKVEQLLKKPWAIDGKNFSDRIWADKEKLVSRLHTELTQNMIRGASPDRAIENISKAMNTSRKQAGRLVMTESAAISSKAQQDCFKELGVEEFEVVVTLDHITCDLCQGMDGKHFPLSDFRIGETAPPFHPNCRCCTIPYFDEDFGQAGERAARDPETGKTYYVPADMTYKQWKDSFVEDKDMINQGTMQLNKGEQGAIMRYVSPDSITLNDKLRRGEELTAGETEWVKDLNSALKKLPCYEGNLNRSLMFKSSEDAREFFDNFTVDGEFIPKQFFSTTKEGMYNEEGQVQIYIQKAKKGHDLGNFAIENEVLYSTDIRFKILNKVVEEGIYWILLEEE